MRLATEEHSAISETIRRTDREAQIYLFGSRVDDTAKGGDIDLLVLSKNIDLLAIAGHSCATAPQVGGTQN